MASPGPTHPDDAPDPESTPPAAGGPPVVFAYPGDLSAPTGGYAYDRQLIAGLEARGRAVEPLQLPGAFPAPTPEEARAAVSRLAAVPSDRVIIIDGLAYGALGARELARVRAPMIALVHHPLALETGIDPSAASAIAAREREALARAAAVVVTSPHTRDTLAADYDIGVARITVARPGLDAAWHQTQGRKPADPPRIVAVGSVLPRKGYDVLVAALAQLRDLRWTLDIAGALDRAPATVEALRAQLRALGLERRVALHGAVPNETISALFRTARVFALPSRYEGYGMVFAEAMAAGLPVVAARAGAVPDVVPPEAGILVPVDDATATAEALRGILTDDALAARLSSGAEDAARGFHGWDETARLVDGLVMRLEERP